MRPGVVWTEELDQRLRGLRGSGETWDGVAAAMGFGRNTVLERARRIGARAGRAALPRVVSEPADRLARPPGHPDTWALINQGTVLEGAPYPYPVFL